MPTRPKLISAPAFEPVTIEEARAHLEAQPYGDSDTDAIDDAMILGFVSAARQACEQFTGLSIAPAVIEIALDAWPSAAGADGAQIELPGGPIRRVLQVTVGDPLASDAAIDPDLYWLDDFALVPRLMPALGYWPATPAAGYLNAIRVRYEVGFAAPGEADAASSSSDSEAVDPLPLPPAIRAAILLLLGHLYENREAINVGNLVTTLPLGVHALLRPYRVLRGMA